MTGADLIRNLTFWTCWGLSSFWFIHYGILGVGLGLLAGAGIGLGAVLLVSLILLAMR